MSQSQVLAKLQNGEIDAAEAARQLAELENGPIRFKVSEKGAVSVYGLQKFPVTLYRDQWEQVFGFADKVRQFIKDNDADLLTKAESKESRKTA